MLFTMDATTPDSVENKHLARNIALYPWYAGLFNCFFWMPVFFLFFNEHLTVSQVLRLEAIYYVAVVLLEVPSGFFSDVVGRRVTLLISSLAFLAGYLLFFFGTGIDGVPIFAIFSVAQVLLAMGIAFNSGTDASFHYDSLAAMGLEAEYAPREAHVSRVGFIGSAVAALAGGAVGLVDLRYAYGLSAIATVAMLAIVILFREPTTHESRSLLAAGFARQLRACVKYLRQPTLAWIFAFSVLMVVLNHVPYEFYQPYIRLLGDRIDLLGRGTPLIAGVHMAIVMLIASFVAGRSVRISKRLGLGGALLAAMALQTGVIAAMGLVLHPLVLVLVLLRSVPRAMMTAPVNAAVTPRIDRAHRATYVSLQSVVGRLSFSITLVGLSLLPGHADADDWASLSRMQLVAAGIGVAALLVLGLSVRRGMRVRDDSDQSIHQDHR